MAENTGNKVYTKLKKVVDGGAFDGDPLDINNRRTEMTGLPQAEKDNLPEDEDYVAPSEDLTMCPLNDFTLTPVTGAALNTEYESNIVTVIGIQGTAPVGLIGSGQYSKNGGSYTSTGSTVVNGDTVRIKNTSSNSYSTMNSTTLKIGSVLRQFTITTQAAP